MRKFLSILLTVLMLASLCTVASSAADYRPDLVITKISPDQKKLEGRAWSTGSDGADAFEALEIVNTSGKPLNLYEYGIYYNGNTATSEKFNLIWEVTPFKAGDIHDESTLTWDGYPTNPDEFIMDIGEVVVVWSVYTDAKGAKMEDFRDFWQLPDDVRSIAWDGNSSTGNGGADKNFNLKNSATGTYGIYKQGETIAQEKSTHADGCAYSTISFGNDGAPAKSIANGAAMFGFDGARKMKLVDYTDDMQFGKLSDQQIEMFGDLLKEYVEPSVDLEALAAEYNRKLAMVLNIITSPIF